MTAIHSTIILLLSASISHAATVIYDGSAADLNIIDNAANSTGTNTLTGGTGALCFLNTNGNNNNSGFASMANVDTLLGRTLTASDSLAFSMVVDGITGDIKANGIEFGLSSDGTSFRGAGSTLGTNLLLQLDDAGTISGMAPGNFPGETANAAGWGVTEASLLDGFTVTLEADSSGYLFTVSDIVDASTPATTTRTFGGSFTGTQFVDNFATGHIYFSAQKNTNPDLEAKVSEFSISLVDEPSLVPEPSRALLAGLGLTACLLRRRR